MTDYGEERRGEEKRWLLLREKTSKVGDKVAAVEI